MLDLPLNIFTNIHKTKPPVNQERIRLAGEIRDENM